MLEQPGRKGGGGETHMRGAERYAQLRDVPFLGFEEQPADFRVDQPDPDGMGPPVGVRLHAARQEYLQHVAVVLFQPPHALITQPAGQKKGLGDVRRKPLDQDAAHHAGEHKPPVAPEHLAAGKQRRQVEPIRRLNGVREEFPDRCRRPTQRVAFTIVHAKPDKPFRLLISEWFEIVDHRIRERVSDHGMLDVVGRPIPIGPQTSFPPVRVSGRHRGRAACSAPRTAPVRFEIRIRQNGFSI